MERIKEVTAGIIVDENRISIDQRGISTRNDVIEVKENILKDIVVEYVDDIEYEGDKQYYLSLFLLSSDYAVIVVAIKEIMDIILEE